MTTVEGDRWMWNCRLLVQHLCCYCEHEHGPVPRGFLSNCNMALALGATAGHSRPLGIIARTQFSLSLHFSKLGREVSRICFKMVQERKLPFLRLS